MPENGRSNDHQRFKELAALAQGRGLTVSEHVELKHHLRLCEACREIFSEYSLLSSEGMAFLAVDCGRVAEADDWDYEAAQTGLFSLVRRSEVSPNGRASRPDKAHIFLPWAWRAPWVGAAATACLLAAVAAGAYHLGIRHQSSSAQASDIALVPSVVFPSSRVLHELAREKKKP